MRKERQEKREKRILVEERGREIARTFASGMQPATPLLLPTSSSSS